MKLVDLEPRWLTKDGRRIGFTFISPVDPGFRQSCFPIPPDTSEQVNIFENAHGDDIVQPCNPEHRWSIAGGIDAADFASISVTPSLDGSAADLWHGFITNGQIVGGI